MIIIHAVTTCHNAAANNANTVNYAFFQDSVPKTATNKPKDPFSSADTISPLFSNIDPATYKGDPFYPGEGGDVAPASGPGAPAPNGTYADGNTIEWDYGGASKKGPVIPTLTVKLAGDQTRSIADYLGYSLSPGQEGTYFELAGVWKYDGKSVKPASLPKHLYNSKPDVKVAASNTPDPTQGFDKGNSAPEVKLELKDSAAGTYVLMSQNGKDTLYNVHRVSGLGAAGMFISKKPNKGDNTYKMFNFNGQGGAAANDIPEATAKTLLQMQPQ